MKKVYGEDISIKKLKKCYFGYSDNANSLDEIVDTIECNGCRYTLNEEGTAIIRYPIDIDSNIFADYYILKKNEIENITVYHFIKNWWGLDEYDLEDFIFYF